MRKLQILACAALMASAFATRAQEPVEAPQIDAEEVVQTISVSDSLLSTLPADTVLPVTPLPKIFFLPAVYKSYVIPENVDPFAVISDSTSQWRWLEDAILADSRGKAIMQNIMLSNPDVIIYNVRNLPEPPKEYQVTINPQDHTIKIDEIQPIEKEKTDLEVAEVQLRHWIREFNGLLQFSQSYISPNWYQGGNNNVNGLLNLYYNVKLNQALHPKLLFETTFQYKLGVNSTPDDQYRKYNISEDLFQINSVLGLKAAKKWYYSITGMFKTQMVNSYTKGTDQLRSAFMSPAELNIGLGMTYNTVNANKTINFDMSINPISYNLKVCTNSRLDPTSFGIDAGKKTKSTVGSSAEFKLNWQIRDNISLRSRLFGFTDYDRFYCDWENVMSFQLTKFFSTQLFFDLRYDTDTPKIDDQTKWKKLQLKEVLSIGFSYKFSSL